MQGSKRQAAIQLYILSIKIGQKLPLLNIYFIYMLPEEEEQVKTLELPLNGSIS